MGIDIGTTVNKDDEQTPTTGYFGDPGDGLGNKLYHWYRSAVLGERTDAGSTVTDGTAASAIALLKGIGIRLAAIATSVATAATQLSVGATALLKAEDAAHAGGDAGVQALAVRRDTKAASSGTTGDYEPLQTNATGELRTVDDVAAKVGLLTNASTTALAASLVVKGSAGTLFGLQGYATSAGFLLVHNTASLPADASVPVVSLPIESGKPFSVDFGVYGRAFSTGIVVVFSSTGPTKTIGGSVMWVDAQFV